MLVGRVVPAYRAWYAPLGSSGSKGNAMSAAKKTPVILIVDSGPWSRDLLGQLVFGVRCGARLVLYGDGRETLAHCRCRRFALILAELNLP